jgi:hypothetical protein
MQDNYLKVKIRSPFKDANMNYGDEFGSIGFPLRYKLLEIADMADKDFLFQVKRYKKQFFIDKDKARYLAKKFNAFFTAKNKDLYIVVPKDHCVVIN